MNMKLLLNLYMNIMNAISEFFFPSFTYFMWRILGRILMNFAHLGGRRSSLRRRRFPCLGPADWMSVSWLIGSVGKSQPWKNHDNSTVDCVDVTVDVQGFNPLRLCISRWFSWKVPAELSQCMIVTMDYVEFLQIVFCHPFLGQSENAETRMMDIVIVINDESD